MSNTNSKNLTGEENVKHMSSLMGSLVFKVLASQGSRVHKVLESEGKQIWQKQSKTFENLKGVRGVLIILF